MDHNDIGPKGKEVMMAFARAAASGWINDEQDVFVHVKVLEALVSGSTHAVAGAIGHLIEAGYLAPVEGRFVHSDDARTSRWRDWYGPTIKAGEWFVASGLVPADLVGAFFPHTSGWEVSDIEHFATNFDLFCGDLEEWAGKTFLADDRTAEADKAHKLALQELDA